MRIKLSNGTGSCDDVSFLFDGAWLGKAQGVTADSEAGTCYVTKRGVAPRAAPYLIAARIQQGNTTLYAAHRNVQVISDTTISLSSPEAGKTLTAPASITLNATATVGSGSITRVEFYNGSTKLGEDSSAPYSYSWMAVPVGNYANLTAKLVDSLGGVTTSAPVAVTVTASQGGGGDTPVKISFASSYVDSLITGGVDAGSLPGEFGVGADGAASYSLPIAVPPGTAGMVPSLSLQYSSRAGNSLIGLGWRLNGFSNIHRCAKTIIQDGEPGAMRFNQADRLCLDGQRLVLVNLPLSDANYWADTAEYRTEIDSFRRITALVSNGKRGFKVQEKEGRTLYYGDSADSYVEGQGRPDGLAHAWMLRRSEDRAGNAIDYQYSENAVTGEHLPATIRWGGNAAANQAHYAKVVFAYGTDSDGNAERPDADIRYLAGSRIDLRKRLASIQTFTDTAADGSGGVPAQALKLQYDLSPSSGRSLLKSVQACAAGQCLPATRFTWGEAPTNAPSFVSQGQGQGPAIATSTTGLTPYDPASWARVVVADFNGDGKSDLLGDDGVYLAQGNGFNRLPYAPSAIKLPKNGAWEVPHQLIHGDFDGSGRTAFIDLRQDAGSKLYFGKLCRVTNNQVVCAAEFNLGTNPALTGLVADVDGRGRDEVLTKEGNGKRCAVSDQGLNCRPYNGVATLLDLDAVEIDPLSSVIPSGSDLATTGGDVDGDGIRDYIMSDGTICLSQPTGFQCDGQAIATRFPGVFKIVVLSRGDHFGGRVGDLNGDGYADFAVMTLDSVGKARYALCYGTGLVGRVDCSDVSTLPGLANIVDLEGEKQPKLLTKSTSGQLASCILRNRALNCRPVAAPENWHGPDLPTLANNYLYGDFDGDGRSDIVTYRGAGTPNWERYTVQAPQGIDRIIRVSNDVVPLAEVEYAAQNDRAVYSVSADPVVYPNTRVNGVGQLVQVSRQSTGQGNWKESRYTYTDAASDLLGRGFLGFTSQTVNDPAVGIGTTQIFSQAWPTIGRPYARSSLTANGNALSRATFSMSALTLRQPNGQSTVFPYLQKSDMVRRDLDWSDLGSSTIVNVYDNWGNLKQADSTNSGNGTTFRSLTVNTYQAANASDAPWMQGLLARTVTTKTDAYGQTLSRTIAYGYDAKGLPASETVEPDDASLKFKLLTTFDRSGNAYGLVTRKSQTWRDPVSNTDRSRTLEATQYDTKGRFAETVKNALGHAEKQAFDPRTGKQTGLTDANQLVTLWIVDGFGRQRVERHPDGTETRSYLKQCNGGCPISNATQVAITEHYKGADRIAVPTLVYSDSAGHVLRTQTWGFGGDVIVTDNRYDSRGRLQQSDQPTYLGNVAKLASRYVYDDLDRVTLVATLNEGSGPGRDVEQFSTTTYQGLQTVLENANKQRKTDIRDVLGRLVVSKDAKVGITEFAYDPFGNLKQTIDPGKNIVRITYDSLGRRTDLNDLDIGTIHYDVDPLGRVWKQTDAKQQVTRSTYDDLDRLTSRSEPSLESRWVYDTAVYGIGQLAEAYTLRDNKRDYQRTHVYDDKGRLKTTTLQLDKAYTSTTTYDDWGRLQSQVHQRDTDVSKAKRFDQRYNQYGYLSRIERQGVALWEATKQDAANRVIEAKLGNGLKVTQTYNAYTGRLSESDLTSPQHGMQLRESYFYEKLGNIEQRSQFWADSSLTETFKYDELNRLIKATIGPSAQDFSYDAIGNMLSKTGAGTYTYPPQGQAVRAANSGGPHAVSSISSLGAFRYDANGNLVEGAGRKLSWTSFDMPHCITTGSLNADGRCGSGTSSEFAYGTEHQRAKQIKSDGTTIYYAGAIEAETIGSTVKSIKTYWPNGLGVEIDKGSSTEQHWTHVDRLGSVVAISDQTGALKERLSYDVWGKRRNLNGSANNVDGVIDNKGFTGHEMLDGLDLVHMNGRVYDPLVARFMSADPIIQDPEHSQSYNRYSYVWNNPTNLTDPTGFRGQKDESSSLTANGGGDWVTVYCAEDCGSGSSTNHEATGGGESGGESGAEGSKNGAGQVERTWGSYLPGTTAGDSAAQWYADKYLETGSPLYYAGGVVASLWTPDTAAETTINLAGGGIAAGAKAGFTYASSKIIGNAQSTGTVGHATVSKIVAYAYALNPNVERVTLDLGYRRLLEGVREMTLKYGPRPDVGALYKNTSVKITEIASKTDVPQELIRRNAVKMSREGINGSVSVNNWAVWINKVFGN
ncbi:SpvB/TcaC N-terminal domain-containing protein [Chitinimonas arctica]|nr:SpvB/TcaC N-terminal domain-containing protein [Chitinimonas arctica]